MVGKIAGLARALAILLAVIAAFVTMGSLNVALAIVVLGLIAGLSLAADELLGVGVTVLVLPAVGLALGQIPTVGTQLTAVAGNFAMALAASLATAIAIATFNYVKNELMGLAK